MIRSRTKICLRVESLGERITPSTVSGAGDLSGPHSPTIVIAQVSPSPVSNDPAADDGDFTSGGGETQTIATHGYIRIKKLNSGG